MTTEILPTTTQTDPTDAIPPKEAVASKDEATTGADLSLDKAVDYVNNQTATLSLSNDEGTTIATAAITEEKPKKRNLFNNPFNKKASKKEEDNHEPKSPVEDGIKNTSEKKVTKGFGSIYSKIKVSLKLYLKLMMSYMVDKLYL